MNHVKFGEQPEHVSLHSDVTGTEFSGDRVVVYKVHFEPAQGAEPHAHPEEQFMYVISGRLRVTVDGEPFEVAGGEAAWFPPNAEHQSEAIEPTDAISFKRLP